MQFTETIVRLFHPQRSNNHRPRLLHVESYLSMIGVVIGFTAFVVLSGRFNSRFGNILGYASDISVGDVITYTNAERARAGLPGLTYNERLSQAAAGKAQDMFAKQYWAHQSPDGVEPWAFINGAGYSYIAAGENLARDFNTTPDMVAAWMASPTHAANIMNARYQEIGVAVVNGNLEGIETTLVVQMFGRPNVQQVAAQTTPEAAQTQEIVSVPAAETVVETTPVAGSEVNTVADLGLPSTVLAEAAVPAGSITPTRALFSPLELTKAFGMSMLLLIVGTLTLDWYVSHKNGTIRLVGKNFAHIIFFTAICFVLILFRGGFVF